MRQQQQPSIPGNDFGGTLRVLLAQQEQAVRDVLAERIQDTLGVEADAVNTASAVRKLVDTHAGEFVLAVVDTRLPDAPNGEVLETLTSHKIPTIVLSSQIDDAVAERLEDRHIIDCVLKRNDEDINLIADLVQRTLLNHRRKIIFYSNNDFNRKNIRQLLDIHRYTVIDVRSETEVRRQIDNHPDTSLVLIDHTTIELDELTLINSLRRQYRREDMSIAVVCESMNSNSSARMLRAGANDVILKQHQTNEFYYRVQQCVEAIERVREIKFSATRDPLTGLYNRDHLFDVGEKMYASAQRGDIKLTLAMIEIDNFDSITTRHGIEVSNEVMRTIAPILQNELRKNDVLARYKAGTFVCLASNVGNHNAIMVFERIRQKISKTVIEYGSNVLSISGSIGATTYPDETFRTMIGNAQSALDNAFSQGGNSVSVED